MRQVDDQLRIRGAPVAAPRRFPFAPRPAAARSAIDPSALA